MSHRTRKSRGSAAERELVHKFWDAGWAAFRAPASGAMPIQIPDVIAGHGNRKLGIEIKLTKESKKYFTKQEVEDLQGFCARFGSECWLGVKFLRKGWFFLSPEDMRQTASSYVVSYEEAQKKGLSFEELIDSIV
ncbi:Holliday junction resolvase [Candidatus Woesearchaeota archaeon]|nr:Holliday junction resolvase [Candidatus Woesearchaeota archaeon]